MVPADSGDASPPPEQGKTKDDLDDFENCKGQCGYTIWCRECMANRDKHVFASIADTNSGEEEPPDADAADGGDGRLA
jgi:hypothetical protein